jgi:AraC-like DNA-binding protein
MQRVLRFQRFLALNHRHAQSSEDGLGRLAWAAGYADQSHLTRECAALTGLPPTRFLEERTRSCGTSHDHKTMFAPFVPGRIETTLRPTPSARGVQTRSGDGFSPGARSAATLKP